MTVDELFGIKKEVKKEVTEKSCALHSHYLYITKLIRFFQNANFSTTLFILSAILSLHRLPILPSWVCSTQRVG